LDLDVPILEALAICGQPLLYTHTGLGGAHYVLQRTKQEHCLWGPSTVFKTRHDGTNVFWKKNGLFDSDDGPAIHIGIPTSFDFPGHFTKQLIGNPGSEFWLRSGKLHRLDGPAIEHANGDKEWWIEGSLVRRQSNGTVWYYEPRIPPREPSVVHNISDCYQLHRENGPAVIGDEICWYWHGIRGVQMREISDQEIQDIWKGFDELSTKRLKTSNENLGNVDPF
jgi:hypothetical protein